MKEFLQVILHSIIIYFFLVILARLIGRKLLSQMTFFDFVIGITIGTIGGAFVTTEVKGYYVLISPIVLTALVIMTGFLTFKSVTARKLIEGEPIVLIQNGKIFEKNLKKIRFNSDDLQSQLRFQGVFNLDDVEFAVIEPHGQLSVLKKSQNLPVTPKDLQIPTSYKGLSTEIIRDGRIEEENLKQNNLTHEWLFNELARRNIKQIEDVFLATLSTEGTLYVDLCEDPVDYLQKTEDDDSLI